jgi:hypothetical protein
MFPFGKNDDASTDPKAALGNASDMLNKGLMGGLTKAFMGQGFVDKMNGAIATGNQALENAEVAKDVAQNGADATAQVLSVQDTGITTNMNPVVLLTLKVTPVAGAEFQTTAQVMVSRIAIPRVGDTIKIKYNPQNTSQIAIV